MAKVTSKKKSGPERQGTT